MLAYLFPAFLLGQTLDIPSGSLLIGAVDAPGPTQGGDYRLYCLFGDLTGEHQSDSIAVGDFVYIVRGDVCAPYEVSYIHDNAGGIADIEVLDVTSYGKPTGGEANYTRHTPNRGYPLIVTEGVAPNGIGNTLRQRVMDHLIMLLDQDINDVFESDSNTDTLFFRYAPDSVIMAVRNDTVDMPVPGGGTPGDTGALYTVNNGLSILPVDTNFQLGGLLIRNTEVGGWNPDSSQSYEMRFAYERTNNNQDTLNFWEANDYFKTQTTNIGVLTQDSVVSWDYLSAGGDTLQLYQLNKIRGNYRAEKQFLMEDRYVLVDHLGEDLVENKPFYKGLELDITNARLFGENVNATGNPRVAVNVGAGEVAGVNVPPDYPAIYIEDWQVDSGTVAPEIGAFLQNQSPQGRAQWAFYSFPTDESPGKEYALVTDTSGNLVWDTLIRPKQVVASTVNNKLGIEVMENDSMYKVGLDIVNRVKVDTSTINNNPAAVEFIVHNLLTGQNQKTNLADIARAIDSVGTSTYYYIAKFVDTTYTVSSADTLDLTDLQGVDSVFVYDTLTIYDTTVIGGALSGCSFGVSAPSHSFPVDTVSKYGAIPVHINGGTISSATTLSRHDAFVVAAPTADSLVLQVCGYVDYSGAEYTSGEYYYLQEDGSITNQPDPETYASLFKVTNDKLLLLVEDYLKTDTTGGSGDGGSGTPQTLSFSSPNLSISDGNSVDLSALQDGAGTDDQTAAEVPFTASGGLSAANVQDALEELDAEKADTAHTHTESDITDLNHFTGADITGSESAFAGWDKNDADDFSGVFSDLSAIPAGLSDGDDVGTDNQTLTFNNPNLSISGGNSVDLSAIAGGSDINIYDDNGTLPGNRALTLNGYDLFFRGFGSKYYVFTPENNLQVWDNWGSITGSSGIENTIGILNGGTVSTPYGTESAIYGLRDMILNESMDNSFFMAYAHDYSDQSEPTPQIGTFMRSMGLFSISGHDMYDPFTGSISDANNNFLFGQRLKWNHSGINNIVSFGNNIDLTGDNGVFVVNASDNDPYTTSTDPWDIAPDQDERVYMLAPNGFELGTSSSGGSINTGMEISSSGQIKFDTYGSGTHTGTATKFLAVDASGNVIEEDVLNVNGSASGSGMSVNGSASGSTPFSPNQIDLGGSAIYTKTFVVGAQEQTYPTFINPVQWGHYYIQFDASLTVHWPTNVNNPDGTNVGSLSVPAGGYVYHIIYNGTNFIMVNKH